MHLPNRLAELIPGRTVDPTTVSAGDSEPAGTDSSGPADTPTATDAAADIESPADTPDDGNAANVVDDAEAPDESTDQEVPSDASDVDSSPPPTSTVRNTARKPMHATRVAPSGVHLESKTARVDTRWVKVLFVTGFPDTATPGLLDRVCTHPSADVDVTIHTNPQDIQTSLLRFQRAIKGLKVDLIEAREQGSARATVTERRIREHESIYRQLRDGAQRVINVGVYFTIRGDSEEAVDTVASTIRGTLQRHQLTTKTAAYRQDDALVTGSPVANDALGQTTPMLGQAAGAMFPFTATTTIEESGVLYGYHASTDAPVVLDRFQRENGYNVLVAGEIGSGKSYDTKCLLLRRVAKDPETDVVMIDPVGGFASLADGLDAEHYVIGGTRTVNPLEIRPTPRHLIDDENLNPFTERISAVMDFFESFFGYVGAPLGDRRQVLERCVREAYSRKGITPDPDTHRQDSPVISDVRAVLGDVAGNPTAVLDGDEYAAGELETWQRHAEDLRVNFEPFTTGGQFAFLNGQTQVDLTGSRVIYLDLRQFGGGADDALAGLVMQPMFDAVYERLKTATGNTIVAIDEAHYLVEASGSVQWLKRTTRYSRHLDLSLHFVTQELADFYDTAGAETFVNQSSIKLLHRQGDLKDRHTQPDALDLTDTQSRFVREAVVGKASLGFSHALLDVDEGSTYPIRVTALPEEEAIIEAESDRNADDGRRVPRGGRDPSTDGQSIDGGPP